MKTFFTIGYGGRSPTELVNALTANDVATLVDVRIRPDKAHSGSFVKSKTSDKGIERLLAGDGVGYRSLVELGNPFVAYPDWETRYRKLIDAAGDLLTSELGSVATPFCLMCAEKDGHRCHRKVIADHLEFRGWIATHL